MSDRTSILGKLISELKQQRDELALQIHLGKAEAGELMGKVQDQLHQLSVEYEPLTEAGKDAAENVLAGLELTAVEVKNGLERIARLVANKISGAN